MASKTADKMDLSLDQIIKLQNKEKRQVSAKASQRQTATTRGRGARGGRGGVRRSANVKVGVVTGLRTRRIGGATGNKAGRQRLAQNLVKRAMLQRRRQVTSQRRAINAAASPNGGGGGVNTQRLVQQMQHWKQTAKALQSALFQQRPVNSVGGRRGGQANKVRINRRVGGIQTNQIGTSSALQSRLGWRGRRGRIASQPVVSERVIRRVPVPASSPRRGVFGQMQSDLLSREAARQQRLANEILAETIRNMERNTDQQRPMVGRRRGGVGGQVIAARRNVGRGRNLNVSRSIQNLDNSFNRRRLGVRGENNNYPSGRAFPNRNFNGGRRGGFQNNRVTANRSNLTRDATNTFRSSFQSSGTTLNDRFSGGGASVTVGRGRRGGRGRRF